ncbi:Col-cuticle-N domain-containing protein [Aphelenchoides besseyi]|nr:Col-cuticle-N domain-containing protein [Aphelenchoides besseyi]
MSAQTAGYCAVGLSLTAFLTLLLYVPTFLQRIGQIDELLKVRSDEFRAIANKAWDELIDVRHLPDEHHRSARQATKTRNLRKAYPLPDTFVIPENIKPACTCQTHNNCLPGPRGMQGRPGLDGTPGERGQAGEQGIVGIVPPIEVRGPSCRTCPRGPRGPTGLAGEIGPPGVEGPQGPKGRNGDDGRPGYAGNPGNMGENGTPGKQGEQGPPGLDGVRGVKGPPGEKGKTGEAGPKGLVGFQGPDDHQDQRDQREIEALKAKTERLGKRDLRDATYCPCPGRTNKPKESQNQAVYGYAPQKYESTSATGGQPGIRPYKRNAALVGRSYPRVI